jgi:cytochrome c peroxidase
LRNLAVAPGFFHNGAFIKLEDAIRFHLDVFAGARSYDPARAGVPADLQLRVGPPVPRKLLDPRILQPVHLNQGQFDDLVSFIRNALLDARVNANTLCGLVPPAVPSGHLVLNFEACR